MKMELKTKKGNFHKIGTDKSSLGSGFCAYCSSGILHSSSKFMILATLPNTVESQVCWKRQLGVENVKELTRLFKTFVLFPFPF